MSLTSQNKNLLTALNTFTIPSYSEKISIKTVYSEGYFKFRRGESHHRKT